METRSFRAPEADGLLDGDSAEYTDAVDIWSMGCVTYWLLVKEAPFSSLSRLNDFVRGYSQFPVRSLNQKGVSEQGISFLRQAIAIGPSVRFTAIAGLKDPWVRTLPLK